MGHKFTPGPWEAERNSSYWEVRPHRKWNDDHIPYSIGDVCASEPGNPDGGLQEANARLIAAAPDLLEALEDMLEDFGLNYMDFDAYDAVTSKAKAAIAKATGYE